MIRAFEEAMNIGEAQSLSISDQLATACAIAGDSLHFAFHHLPAACDELIVSGGGADNPVLLRAMERGAQQSSRRIDDLGVPSRAKEAIAFALLGAATLDGVPSNVPSATGARRAVVLGSITPKP
jgi:anhydro-N-acetylmuramic acid kinase